MPFTDDEDLGGGPMYASPGAGGSAPQAAASYEAIKVDQVNFYHNDPNHQSKTLFVDPEEIYRSHGFTPTGNSVTWNKSAVNKKLNWAGKNTSVIETKGLSATLQTQGALDWGTIAVGLRGPSGKYHHYTEVGFVVIEKASPETNLLLKTNVRQNVTVGSIPRGASEASNKLALTKDEIVAIHGSYENYYYVRTFADKNGTIERSASDPKRWMFIEKSMLYPAPSGTGYGIGVGNPWPGTTYLLPQNEGTTAREAAFDFTRITGDPPYLVGNSTIGYNAHVGNHSKAKKLFNAGKTKYLEYYIGLQWTINEQPGTANVYWAYDIIHSVYHPSIELGDLPRMVKVTRTDDPTKAVYVSVLEAGPGINEGGPLRTSGLSPAAMDALGFVGVGATFATSHGEYGWLTYEWAPGATPGPAE